MEKCLRHDIIRYKAVVAVASSFVPGVFDTSIPGQNAMFKVGSDRLRLNIHYLFPCRLARLFRRSHCYSEQSSGRCSRRPERGLMPRQIFLSVQKMRCACTKRQSPHMAHQARMKRESENEILTPNAKEQKTMKHKAGVSSFKGKIRTITSAIPWNISLISSWTYSISPEVSQRSRRHRIKQKPTTQQYAGKHFSLHCSDPNPSRRQTLEAESGVIFCR